MKELWKCDLCGKRGSVEFEKGEGVYEVSELLWRSHINIAPECEGGKSTIRMGYKEHGLIFTGDLVLKLLADEKTQTRRIVSRMNINVNGQGRCNQEYWDGYDFDDAFVDPGPSPAGNPGPYLKVFNDYCDARDRLYPVYRVGDLIWVRETWNYVQKIEPDYDIHFDSFRSVNFYHKDGYVEDGFRVIYKADPYIKREYSGKWRSPIHLPKAYARIWLEITDVRIQRLWEINGDDIEAEGVPLWKHHDDPQDNLRLYEAPLTTVMRYQRERFIRLWDKINEAKGFGWDVNPWVIAFTFKRIEK